jgi:CheY-like chemotaxis protein
LKSLRYLVVEDHEFQRSVLEQVLLTMGADSVHCAANGSEAMRMLRDPEITVDIVISDLMMLEVDGIELLPMLGRVLPPVSLILTSTDEWTLRAAFEIAKSHGIRVLGTIMKPVTPGKLLPLIDFQ